MKFTKEDDKDTVLLAQIINRVYKAERTYFDLTSDKIFASQPYILEFMLSYRTDVSKDELEEIIKMCFVVWEFFYGKKHVKYNKIMDDQSLASLKKNHHMLAYLEGEFDKGRGGEVLESNISPIKSKALLAFIFGNIKDCIALSQIDIQNKGMLLLDFQSLVECFEANEEQM